MLFGLGLLRFSPEDLRVPISVRMGERKILQPNDLTILLNEDTTLYKGKRQIDPYIYAYRFQVLTGLRLGELIGLRWEDIKRKNIIIRRAVNILGEETRGKNDNAKPHHSSFRHCMEATGGTRNLKKGITFPISNEQHYYTRWKRYCASNNITQTSVYKLRHTFVSIAQALPEAQLKRLVGHSKAMDTYGIYSHSVDGENESTAILLDDTFSRFAK